MPTETQAQFDAVQDYFRARPYYYTDGKRYYANPSYRKQRGLTYIGRFPNAKEARLHWEQEEDFRKRFKEVNLDES